MPVFYLDVCTRGRMEADETDLELASAETAYAGTGAAIPRLTAELLRAGNHPADYAFMVTTEAG